MRANVQTMPRLVSLPVCLHSCHPPPVPVIPPPSEPPDCGAKSPESRRRRFAELLVALELADALAVDLPAEVTVAQRAKKAASVFSRILRHDETLAAFDASRHPPRAQCHPLPYGSTKAPTLQLAHQRSAYH